MLVEAAYLGLDESDSVDGWLRRSTNCNRKEVRVAMCYGYLHDETTGSNSENVSAFSANKLV